MTDKFSRRPGLAAHAQYRVPVTRRFSKIDVKYSSRLRDRQDKVPERLMGGLEPVYYFPTQLLPNPTRQQRIQNLTLLWHLGYPTGTRGVREWEGNIGSPLTSRSMPKSAGHPLVSLTSSHKIDLNSPTVALGGIGVDQTWSSARSWSQLSLYTSDLVILADNLASGSNGGAMANDSMKQNKDKYKPSSWNHNSQWLLNSDNNQLNLVVLGVDGLSEELADEIRVQCDEDEYEIDCQLYSVDYRIIDGDVSLPQNSFKTPDFSPNVYWPVAVCVTLEAISSTAQRPASSPHSSMRTDLRDHSSLLTTNYASPNKIRQSICAGWVRADSCLDCVSLFQKSSTPLTPLPILAARALRTHDPKRSSPETREEEIEPSVRASYLSELDPKPNRENSTSPKASRGENQAPFVPRVETHQKFWMELLTGPLVDVVPVMLLLEGIISERLCFDRLRMELLSGPMVDIIDSDITSDDDNVPDLRNPAVHNMSDSYENGMDDEDYREIPSPKQLLPPPESE
uniref:PG1 pseudoGTPase domain-containing protein n=1 Tax=Timema monikensis TaxID=170555 RepID=A0A7R9HN01_9NEOP|nr:unnamed protein product [Timema monikensis]